MVPSAPRIPDVCHSDPAVNGRKQLSRNPSRHTRFWFLRSRSARVGAVGPPLLMGARGVPRVRERARSGARTGSASASTERGVGREFWGGQFVFFYLMEAGLVVVQGGQKINNNKLVIIYFFFMFRVVSICYLTLKRPLSVLEKSSRNLQTPRLYILINIPSYLRCIAPCKYPT